MGKRAVEESQDWRDALALHYPRVRAWYAHVLADPAAVDDLTQEVFVRLCDCHARGEVMAEPWSFIKVVARNVFLEHLRAQRRQNAFVSLNSETMADALPQPAEACEQEETLKAVPQLLDRLPVTSRYILVGRYFLGMTAREMAEAMGVAISTITERHNRAVCDLRKLVVSQESTYRGTL